MSPPTEGMSPVYKFSLAVLLAAVLLTLSDPPSLPRGSAVNPFSWYPRDNFDYIMEKMSKANPNNCPYLSEADLTLPATSVSQLPAYNRIPLQIWFVNRSKLMHLHNVALNRAYFYSYILQRLNATDTAPPLLPSLLYYYFAASADVSSAPNALNVSGMFMDTNCSYASWYVVESVNTTFPLFAPIARRLDNWNDETNILRVPSNNTIELTDMGAGPNNNYTAPWYKNNPYIHDKEMGITYIPDHRGTALGKNQYSTRSQLADLYGRPLEQLEIVNFFGPNAPGIKETFLPVRFTRPYYDCGHSNRWIVSAVSALSDYMPRYSPIDRLRGPRMVGVIVTSMDFLRIDFNPCKASLGNPAHFLAGVARCKSTTMCVPLPGFGFARGGYECVCQPGYRLPMQQNGPFRGIDIEQATELEYQNGFDCLPIGWREVVPYEISIRGSLQRVRRSSNQSIETTTDKQEDESVFLLRGFLNRTARKASALLSSVGHDLGRLLRYFSNTGLASPEGVENETSAVASSVHRKLTPSASRFAALGEATGENSANEVSTELSRPKRELSIPFYYIGGGYTFSQQAFDEVQRLITYVDTVTPENCASKAPEDLIMPGGVSYGAEVQFEMEGRMALRLAHFLSAYYQNNIVGELYGNLKSGSPLNRFELFGEVYATVLSSFQIVSAGVFFDHQAFTDHDGVTWDLFAPYAYKPTMSSQVAEAIDMSVQTFRNYTQQPWFRILKERWVSSRFGLERMTTKPYIRSNINGTQVQRYFNFPLFYRIPRYEDGYWTEPYYVCYGFQNGWVITYAAPFFGFLDNRKTLDFMGVVTVSVHLAHLDLNQCPQSFYTPNFFKNSAVCDFKNTYCEPIPGRRFRSGSYKCMCRQGFEYPFNDLSWFFDGETMEREYELKLLGKPSRYDLLKCRQGMATRIPISKSTILLLLALVWAATYGRP
ncbi:hypothetical protein AAHC03_021027 [Spirometra sp. Aus1]